MRTIYFFLLMMIMGGVCYAEREMYLVDRESQGEPAAIVYFNPSSQNSLADQLRWMGLDGLPIQRIYNDDFPATREDRNFWQMNDVPMGKKIKVDAVKKQAHLDDKAAKKAAKKSVLDKACNQCTEAEWELLFGEL